MKHVFFNPVLSNPWKNVPPVFYVPSRNPNTNFKKSDTQHSSIIFNPRKASRAARNTKRKNCIEKLSKLYPTLPKSKINAALTICDSNITDTVNLLELRKINFDRNKIGSLPFLPPKKRKRILSTDSSTGSVFVDTTSAEAEDLLKSTNSEEDGAIDLQKNFKGEIKVQYFCEDYKDSYVDSTEVKDCTVPPCGTFPNLRNGVLPVPYVCISSSYNTSSKELSLSGTTTVTAHSSDVFEFSESEFMGSPSELPKPSRKPVSKIGIVIKRKGNGSYTVTLM